MNSTEPKTAPPPTDEHHVYGARIETNIEQRLSEMEADYRQRMAILAPIFQLSASLKQQGLKLWSAPLGSLPDFPQVRFSPVNQGPTIFVSCFRKEPWGIRVSCTIEDERIEHLFTERDGYAPIYDCIAKLIGRLVAQQRFSAAVEKLHRSALEDALRNDALRDGAALDDGLRAQLAETLTQGIEDGLKAGIAAGLPTDQGVTNQS